MTQTTPQSDSSWLAGEELDAARQRLPILYVDAIPVRVDAQGVVTTVGLLLRVTGEGRIARALVSGRVLYHERVRSALLRHLEKDLGPLALPQGAARAAAVHDRRILPDAGRDAVPRPAPARGLAGLRRAGRGRLRAAAGRAGADLVQPGGGQPTSGCWPR